MNERIQTLLAKFKETESTHRGAHVLIGSDEIEKFAELIVAECSQISRDHQRIYYESHGDRIAKKIKEHFGVEE